MTTIIELKTKPLGFQVRVPIDEEREYRAFAPLDVAAAQALILALLAQLAAIESETRHVAEGDASFLRSVGVKA